MTFMQYFQMKRDKLNQIHETKLLVYSHSSLTSSIYFYIIMYFCIVLYFKVFTAEFSFTKAGVDGVCWCDTLSH